MFPNRMESYRHSFGKPLEIRMEIQRENEVQRRIFGLLLDVSPGGAKIFSEYELPLGTVAVKFFSKSITRILLQVENWYGSPQFQMVGFTE
ncbi:hypothetical protein FK545_01500 [Planococcus glaciei]|nr:hypothetical protein [Planococcus glaciei]QDY44667.1 hypothetical protein FK545_01500 [Planococcus glaciei]